MAGRRVGWGVTKPCDSCQSNILCSAHFFFGIVFYWIITSTYVTAKTDEFPEFLEQPSSQIVSHHAPVTLTCSALPEDAQIRWLFNGEPLDVRRHKGLHVQGSNLHFRHLNHGHGENGNDGEYSCTATTPAGTIVSRPAVLSRPALIRFKKTDDVTMTIPEGGYATLTCDPPESSPKAEVKFVREDGTVLDTSQGPYRRLPSGNVIISDITSATVGNFRCVAINPVSGRNVTSSDVIRVKMADKGSDFPKQVFLLPRETNQAQVEVGKDIMLECPTFGIHGNVSWSKYGGSLPKGRHKITEFGNLKIQATEYQDTGTYKCKAQPSGKSSHSPSSSSSPSPSAQEVRVFLEILTSPAVVVLRSPGKVKVGDRVTLACSVQGFPQPIIRWFHNGRGIVAAPPGHKGDEELVLNSVTLADTGLYQCMATNRLGTAFGLLEMTVKTAVVGKDKEDLDEEDPIGKVDNKSKGKKKTDRRDRRKHSRRMRNRNNKNKDRGGGGGGEKPKYAPTIPTVTQLSDRSVMLNWTVPDKGNGQTIKFFRVQFREFGPNKGLWQTLDDMLASNARLYEVKGLKSRGSYKFRILAVYEDDDNKNSPSTELFKLNYHQHFEPKQPDTPPTIVKATPLVLNNNFGIGIQWQYNVESLSPIEGFVIFYRKHGSDLDYLEVELPGAGIRNHVIRDLQPSTNYEIRMKSFNIIGRSHVSNKVVAMTTPPAAAHMPEYNSHNNAQDRRPPPPNYDNAYDGMGGTAEGSHPGRKPYPDFGAPPDLYDGGLTEQPPSNEDHRRSNNTETLDQPVILGIVLGALLLALAILMAMCWWKQQQHKRNNLNANPPHKFQDQAQCIYSDVGSNPALSKHSTNPATSSSSVGGGGGGLYPQVNGGPPPHLQHNGHVARHGGPGSSHQMNMEINPLAEYDLQTSMGHPMDGRKPPQFYGNGVCPTSHPYPHSASSDSLNNCHQANGHSLCNGGEGILYDEGPVSSSIYPMKHRTLPVAPAPQPLTSSFYAEANTGSLGRRQVLNHDYSEPHAERELHQHQHFHHHPQQQHPMVASNPHPSGGSGMRHSPNQFGGGPHHVTTATSTGNPHYEWSYDQPLSGGNPHDVEHMNNANIIASMERSMSPSYPIMGSNDFAGAVNPAMPPPTSSRLPMSYSGPGMVGRDMGYHGNGKHKRRRKRAAAGERNPRDNGMKDQATNTDLSSNEGTFDFTSFCKSGSSCSNSGSDPGDAGGGCDSSFANNGSLESLEDSNSASSHECPELEPFRLAGRVNTVPL